MVSNCLKGLISLYMLTCQDWAVSALFPTALCPHTGVWVFIAGHTWGRKTLIDQNPTLAFFIQSSASGCQLQPKHLELSPCTCPRKIMLESGSSWIVKSWGLIRENQKAPTLQLSPGWTKGDIGEIFQLFVQISLELTGNKALLIVQIMGLTILKCKTSCLLP